MANHDHTRANPRSSFTATRWTMVAGAQTIDPGRARDALEALYQTYWFPTIRE